MSTADRQQRGHVEIAIAVVEDKGQFLIGLRGDNGPLPGLWEFPGGKIQPGESPEAAAIRECLEESGLLVRITGRYPDVSHDYEHAAVRLHFLACSMTRQQDPLPGRFRWVAAAELDQFAFPPANNDLLRLLAAGKTADAASPRPR